MKRLLVVSGALLVACDGHGDPTKPGGATPTPAPTSCTAGAPQPMTSFTANPSTITDGDAFTLSWAAPCGFVSLAQKDQGPFILNQASMGSYALSPGLAGYPAGAGKTVYVATNGDTLSYASGGVVSGPCTLVEVRGYPIGAVWIAIQMPSTPQNCQVWASAYDNGWQAGSNQAYSPVFTCQ